MIIEQLGFGFAQIRAGLVGGGIWISDGSELLLISSVTRAVSDEWHLGPMQRGFIVTIVYVGVCFGNLFSGPLADSWGRRHLVVWSYFGIFLTSALSAVSSGVLMLTTCRFFVGAAFGIGQPAWSALGSEVTPSHWRVTMTAGTFLLFMLGEVYTSLLLLLDDPQLEVLHWRRLFVLGALPAFFSFFASALLLHDSPSFLALRGRRQEAKAVLQSMRDDNSAGDVDVDFAEPKQAQESLAASSTGDSPEAPAHKFHILMGEQLRGTTLIVMLSCFVVNFICYGSLYAFPQVLTESTVGASPAMSLLLGSFTELPGYLVGIAVGLVMPRKSMMKLYLGLVIVSIMAHLGSYRLPHGSTASLALACAGYFGIKGFVCIGWLGVYVYASEVFPTDVRSSGLAACFAVGRFAASIAPLVFEAGVSITGDGNKSFFTIMALSAMVNLLFIDSLPFETFQRQLRDEVSDEFEEAHAGTEFSASTSYGATKPAKSV